MTMGGSLKRRQPCTMPSCWALTSSLLLLSNDGGVSGRIPQPVVPAAKRKLSYLVDKKIGHDQFFMPVETTTTTTTNREDESWSRQLLEDPLFNETWNVTTLFDYNTTSNSSEVFSTLSNGTSDDQLLFQPIRIRAILPENKFLDQNLTEKLFVEIISPAILAWTAALRVEPVEGNLTVDRSQLTDGKSCGPGIDSGYPSVIVPESHFNQGLPDTDFLVYLNLGQPDTDNTQPPSAAPTNIFGVSPRDFQSLGDWVIQSTPNHTDTPNPCTGEYIAASTYCSTDQWDRPTAALLHLCLVDDFFLNIHKSMTTIMHELAHSLGFNPQSMAHFRQPDGTPYTERDINGSVPLRQVECTGIPNTTTYATLQLPSTKVMQFRNVRGGVRVAEIVTPHVQQTVRNHFGCFSLPGAELESSNSDGDGCIGEHWERRLFRTDLMNAIIDEVPFSLRISPITLALFADSGWYQVDLSRTSIAAGWGRGSGCDFVERECISNSIVESSNEDYFCNAITTRRGSLEDIQGCSPDMSRKAVCGMAQYESPLPREFQYFPEPDVGGNEPFIDFCPVYTGFSNGECTNATTRVYFKIAPEEEFGAKNSRCVVGLLKGKRRTSLCLPIACVMEDKSLSIKIDGIWKTCKQKGQEFPISGGKINAVCPDPITICPIFYCRLDCLGTNGYCNYETGTCDCITSVNQLNSTNFTVANYSHTNASLAPFKVTECNKISTNTTTFYVNETVTNREIIEDPTLAAIYVVSKSDLKNDTKGSNLVFILIVSLLVSLSIVLVGMVVLGGDRCLRLMLKRNIIPDDDDNDDELPHPPTRRNKDKFVATLLVDLRINHPLESVHEITQEISLPDTARETDFSLSFEEHSQGTPSESSATATPAEESPFVPVEEMRHERNSDGEEEIPSFILRRRFVANGYHDNKMDRFHDVQLL